MPSFEIPPPIETNIKETLPPIPLNQKIKQIAAKVGQAIKNFFTDFKTSVQSKIKIVHYNLTQNTDNQKFKNNLSLFSDQVISHFKKIPHAVSKLYSKIIKQNLASEQKEYSVNSNKFRANYNTLKDQLNRLSKREKLRVAETNEFEIQKRDHQHLHQKTSKNSQETLVRAIALIKEGLIKEYFTIFDVEDLNAIVVNLKKTFGSSEELKQLKSMIQTHETKNLFKKPPEVLYVSKLAGKRINPQELYKLFFDSENKITGDELRTDFLLAGPLMKFYENEKNNNFNALIEHMKTVFINGSKDEKLKILNFTQQLLERGMLENHEDLSGITHFGRSDPDLEIREKAETVIKITSKKVPDSAFQVEYTKTQTTNIQEVFKQLSQSQDKKATKKLIKLLAADIATLSRNYNANVPLSEFLDRRGATPLKDDAIHFNNRLAACINRQILLQFKNDQAQERAKLYEAFVEIAYLLIQNHKDYNAAATITGALTNAAVFNTIKRDGIVTEEKLEKFSQFASSLIKPYNAHKTYVEHDNKQENYNPLLIPFLNVLETVPAGADDKEDNISFAKLRSLASNLEKIENFQSRIERETTLNYDLENFVNASTREWWIDSEGPHINANINTKVYEGLLDKKKSDIHPS